MSGFASQKPEMLKLSLQEKLGDLFRQADFGKGRNVSDSLSSSSLENISPDPKATTSAIPSFKKRPLAEAQPATVPPVVAPQSNPSAYSYTTKETKDTTGLSKSSLVFSSDKDSLLKARDWKLKLLIDTDRFKEQVTLLTKDVKSPKEGTQFVLESQYTITKSLHRSFLKLLDAIQFKHTFSFYWPLSSSGFLAELCGLRMSSYAEVKELKTGERWELHFKAIPAESLIYGYLIKPSEVRRMAQDQATAMLRLRKLPLILDLDDTLVRLVSDLPGRYVPEHQASLVKDRLRTLRDGRRVVIADKLEAFLEWAQKYFEVSICSLGDQTYVDMVVNVIDPQRTRIRGPSYSARQEYSYLMSAELQNEDRMRLIRKRPPKDTRALYSFCEFPGEISLEPLIVDDNMKWWNQDQWDSVIVVRKCLFDQVWNVNFFPVVVKTLEEVHKTFFKKYDAYVLDKEANDVPSVTAYYKAFLRRELGIKISETLPAPPPAAGPEADDVLMIEDDTEIGSNECEESGLTVDACPDSGL